MQQIKYLMSSDVELVHPEETIQTAAQRMRDGGFGLLPVGENDRLVGTITDRDIAVRAVAQGLDGTTKVRSIMSEGVCWAYDDDTVEAACNRMAEHQVRRLPVVNRDKRLVGILALGDIAMDEAQREPAAEAICGVSQPA